MGQSRMRITVTSKVLPFSCYTPLLSTSLLSPYLFHIIKMSITLHSTPSSHTSIFNAPPIVGAEEHSCLVHGDYRLDNMIFREDSGAQP